MKIISFKDFKERSTRIPTISLLDGRKGHFYKFNGMGEYIGYVTYDKMINTMQEFYDWYVWKVVQLREYGTYNAYGEEYEEYNDDPAQFFMFPDEEEYQSKGAIRTLAKRHLLAAKVPRNDWPYLSSSTLVQDVLEAIRDHHEMPGLRGPQVGFYISYDSPEQIAFYI
jgi:hypothetical protein